MQSHGDTKWQSAGKRILQCHIIGPQGTLRVGKSHVICAKDSAFPTGNGKPSKGFKQGSDVRRHLFKGLQEFQLGDWVAGSRELEVAGKSPQSSWCETINKGADHRVRGMGPGLKHVKEVSWTRSPPRDENSERRGSIR